MPFFHYGKKIINSSTSGAFFYYDPGNTSSYNGGNTLFDLSGNNNNATIVNNPLHTSGNGGYFTLDGNDEYILSPNIIDGSNEEHTVEIWIYPTSLNLSLWSDLGQTTPNFNYHFAGGQIYNDGSNYQVITGLWSGTRIQRVINYINTFSPLNKWQQVVRTYDGINLKPYYNGQPGSSSVIDYISPYDYNAGMDWYIAFGASDFTSYTGTTANYFAGRYGIIRYYKRALNDSEVLQNYESDKNKYGL